MLAAAFEKGACLPVAPVPTLGSCAVGLERLAPAPPPPRHPWQGDGTRPSTAVPIIGHLLDRQTRMKPTGRSLRGPTRKAATELPEVVRCTFLVDAAKRATDTHLQLAAHLGQAALRLADAGKVPIHKRTAEELCEKCGTPLLPAAATR